MRVLSTIGAILGLSTLPQRAENRARYPSIPDEDRGHSKTGKDSPPRALPRPAENTAKSTIFHNSIGPWVERKSESVREGRCEPAMGAISQDSGDAIKKYQCHASLTGHPDDSYVPGAMRRMPCVTSRCHQSPGDCETGDLCSRSSRLMFQS